MQPSHQISDAELIRLFLQGHETSLETLINRYKDQIYTSIFMLVKDKYLAEDLFQDTLLKMITTIREGNYSEQGKFLPWAIRVAYNKCIDHFRRVKVRVPITFANGEELHVIATTENALSSMERRQTHHTIRKLIAQLPEDQKEIMVLRIYGELSFKEIAAELNISVNTALGRMRYGIIRLRKMIEAEEAVTG